MDLTSQADHCIDITPILIHLLTMSLVKFGEVRLLRPRKACFDTIVSFWSLLLRLLFLLQLRLLADLTGVGLLAHCLILRLVCLFCLSHIFLEFLINTNEIKTKPC